MTSLSTSELDRDTKRKGAHCTTVRTRSRGVETEFLVSVDDRPLVFFASRDEAVRHAVQLSAALGLAVRVAQVTDRIETPRGTGWRSIPLDEETNNA